MSFKQYQKNDTTLIKLSDKIWIPYNPADLFVSLSKRRSLQYISRWIKRHPVKRGWFINTRDINLDPWHKNYEEILFQSLSNYRIIKKVEYGNLKAILFEKLVKIAGSTESELHKAKEVTRLTGSRSFLLLRLDHL